MAVQNFTSALRFVLADEGGNDDDPHDHGGRTSRGITQREYDAYCRIHRSPSGDVWKASDATVAAIYHTSYWNPYCDAMPGGPDYLYFDIAVNAGPVEAAKTFQHALHVGVDGHYGLVTHDALMAANAKKVIEDVSNARRAWYRSLRQFPRYGKGWLNRVDHAEKNALSLLGG